MPACTITLTILPGRGSAVREPLSERCRGAKRSSAMAFLQGKQAGDASCGVSRSPRPAFAKQTTVYDK